MHKTIDKILASLMAERGVNQSELSNQTKVGQSTISRILKPNGPKGIKEPTDKQVRPLADFFGITTDQLRGHEKISDSPSQESSAVTITTGAGKTSTAALVLDMLKGKNLRPDQLSRIEQAVSDTIEDKPAAQTDNVITADFSRRPTVGDEIRIAHYDVQGAMGGGKVVHDFPEMFRDVTVSQQHLRELGVTYKDPAHLKLITGAGQSMEPTIKDKDPLIADASIREFVGDGIYALSWHGHFYIKRLQVADAEHFEMISDNPKHKDRIVRIDETYIQAKILLVWNATRV